MSANTAAGLLENKIVLIMGAGSGVGRAAALVFARHGARVMCADIRRDWVETTRDRVCAAGGKSAAAVCDVAVESEVQATLDATVAAYGRLDVIFNNVGIASPAGADGWPTKLVDGTREVFDRLVAVNIGGVVNGCKVAVRRFQQQGGGGVIVNTASVAGLIGWGGVVYGATKGAIVALTRSLAIEAAPQGIRVNSVCPAGMITNFGRATELEQPTPELIARYGKLHPLGRPIDPVDCANAALFLASDLSSNITGVNLPVDGGLSAG